MLIRRVSVVSLLFAMMIASVARADVKTEERTKIEFPGMLGGIVKVFGGKAAREGTVSKVALKGNRKMTLNGETAQLVDLAEEKMYQIDMKKKTYTVTTFAELRRQMQEAMDKAKAEAAKAESAPKPQTETKPGEDPKMTMDFKITESGQKKTINGFECREIVATVTVHEKDKKAEDGAMTITSSMWLAPRIAAVKELEEFDLKVAKALLLPVAQEMAAQMTPTMGMYPGLGEAMGKLELEKVNMDGTAILTVIRGDIVGNPEQQKAAAKPAEQPKQSGIPTSLGGLLGGLGRKAAAKKEEPADGKPPSFMTSTTELMNVSTTVSDAEVSIPAGFKEKK